MGLDWGSASLFILLDLSAAFNSINKWDWLGEPLPILVWDTQAAVLELTRPNHRTAFFPMHQLIL